jgi:hypothetical protein
VPAIISGYYKADLANGQTLENKCLNAQKYKRQAEKWDNQMIESE